MSAYLAYSYSTRCGKEEQRRRDSNEWTCGKSRIDFKINI